MEQQNTIKSVGLTDTTAEALQIYCDGVLLTKRIEEFLMGQTEWGIDPSQVDTAFLNMLRDIIGHSIEQTLFEFLPFTNPDDAII